MKRQASTYVSAFPAMPGQGSNSSRDWGGRKANSWTIPPESQSHEDVPARWVSASGSTLASGGVRTGMPIAPPPPHGIFSQHGGNMYGANGEYDQFNSYKPNTRRY